MGGTDTNRAVLAMWEKVAIRQRLGAKERCSPNCYRIILLKEAVNVKGSGRKMTVTPNFHARAKTCVGLWQADCSGVTLVDRPPGLP